MTAFNNKLDWGSKSEWLTPPELVRALGTFDLDVCAPVNAPWRLARKWFTVEDDAFTKDWGGGARRIWMNPPYQEPEAACKRVCRKKRCAERGYHVDRYIPGTADWMKRLADAGNGVGLIFARTETGIFFPHVWRRATGFFVFDARLTFYHVDGTLGAKNSGGPSWLIAYGQENAEALARLADTGVEVKTKTGSRRIGGVYQPILPARAYSIPRLRAA
jgi:DNA N-6-adenine-methyltransferase (Dam)